MCSDEMQGRGDTADDRGGGGREGGWGGVIWGRYAYKAVYVCSKQKRNDARVTTAGNMTGNSGTTGG